MPRVQFPSSPSTYGMAESHEFACKVHGAIAF